MIIYAGSARRQCVHSALRVVTSRRPLGIVFAVLNDRLALQGSPLSGELARDQRD